MSLEERIEAFAALGLQLDLRKNGFEQVVEKASNSNPWFTQDNIQQALSGINYLLERESLKKWTDQYHLEPKSTKKVGIAMAGNIPLVGFHDYLCTLIAGHHAQIKLSAQDSELLPFIHQQLIAIEPRFADKTSFVDRLHGYDAAIATGSDNTSRYFSYYFKDVPHIIRKNRSSCAVLMGEESEAEIESLGDDVFSYFGLGCRNVSKLFLPDEYDLVPLLKTWEKFSPVIEHHKYANNYSYQRSIHLVNLKKFYDNGAILLMEDDRLVSPIAVIYYERYADQEDLKKRIGKYSPKLQCIASAKAWYPQSVSFGKTQMPEVWDYADNVDTMKFLSEV